jgi:ribosomal-protein-alanine N-acetyltransferase
MVEGLKAMKAKGCKECFLEVRAGNSPAITMYERLNFKVSQRLYSYYRDGEDAYLMTKEL